MPYFLARALFNQKYEVVRRDINSKAFMISGQKPFLTLTIIISHFFSERWPSYFSFNHRMFANVDRFCKLFPCTVEFINIWKRWITLFLVNYFLHKQFFHSEMLESFHRAHSSCPLQGKWFISLQQLARWFSIVSKHVWGIKALHCT